MESSGIIINAVIGGVCLFVGWMGGIWHKRKDNTINIVTSESDFNNLQSKSNNEQVEELDFSEIVLHDPIQGDEDEIDCLDVESMLGICDSESNLSLDLSKNEEEIEFTELEETLSNAFDVSEDTDSNILDDIFDDEIELTIYDPDDEEELDFSDFTGGYEEDEDDLDLFFDDLDHGEIDFGELEQAVDNMVKAIKDVIKSHIKR